MQTAWRTAWQGRDIVVFRDDMEVDRFDAATIERVMFVYAGRGESPGDLLHAVVQLPGSFAVLPAETGFAGRVNFERLAFWAERACVFWVAEASARLPARQRTGRWWLRLAKPAYARWPEDTFAPLVADWPLEGPQTWEQRKWRRIEKSRLFAALDDVRDRVRA